MDPSQHSSTRNLSDVSLPNFYGTKVITLNHKELTQDTSFTDMCQLVNTNTIIEISDFTIRPRLTPNGYPRIRYVKAN